jgi:hypothetical protein
LAPGFDAIEATEVRPKGEAVVWVRAEKVHRRPRRSAFRRRLLRRVDSAARREHDEGVTATRDTRTSMTRRALPSDPTIAQFAGAAARAAVFELKARMFADAVGLRGGVSKELDPLVKDIVAWMRANAGANDEDCERVQRCARLRNKLFHLELSRATGQLVSLDAQLRDEGVGMFTWEGELSAEKLIAAIATGGSPVGKTATTDGLVFGWLHQASASGAFGAAARVFDEAGEILERALPGYREEDDERDG